MDILPYLLLAVAGYLLKWLKVVSAQGADFLIRIVFYLGLPALILTTIPSIELKPHLLLLPLISLIIIVVIYFLATQWVKHKQLLPSEAGVFVIGSMIINNGFLIPFIYSAYGKEGLAYLFIFDLSNAVLVYTWIYYLACRYGSAGHETGSLARKILSSPPMWAMVLAFVMNIRGFTLKQGLLLQFLNMAGQLTVPLLMLALGLYFNPVWTKVKNSIPGVLLRMAGGFVLGWSLLNLTGMEGIVYKVVLVCSAAPVGYNTLTYASLEKLDKEMAATMVSLAILVGIILAPFLIWILG